MKVPVTPTQAQQSQSSINVVKSNRGTTRLCNFEPKSVLDLQRSPSPCAKQAQNPEVSPFSDALVIHSGENQVQFDEQVLNNFEDWDSLIRDLGLHDDCNSSVPTLETQFSVLSDCVPSFGGYNQNLSSFDHDNNRMSQWSDDGFNFVDELIRAADCFESGEIQLAQVILARLNQRLQSPTGKPLQRAAFYFKEALQSLLTGSTRSSINSSSYSSEVVQAIKAYRNFSNVSPIIMFSNFTANQAILEAVEGSTFVHVIDFDIGFGGQWASFMRELSDRARSRKTNSPVVRISAVVSEEYALESRLIGDNLSQFAHELKLGFGIEFISIQNFEFLSFKAIKFMDGEKTTVLLSPAIFQRVGPGLLTDLRQLSPHVVVMVDTEGLSGVSTTPSSFRRSVIDGLEFYSTVIESLETASTGAGGGGGEDWIRRIEMFLLRPKILAAVEAAGRRAPPWREAFAVAGFRPLGLSQFADFQAECLLRKVQVRGFHVAKQHAELVLCWQERPLVATSAWRC